jgi:mannose/fructose/N-acetylgalactosamine-specific phosphotransferase system component IIC
MIFSSGLIIVAGFALLLIKLPLRHSLRLLGWGFTLDLLISVLAYALHWGTFSGVMAAAVAGLLCSLLTTSLRWLIGYIDKTGYHPGRWLNLRNKLES